MSDKTYIEMATLPTYEERLAYLRLKGTVSAETFGFDRYFNQRFYRTPEWKQIRRRVILRDKGCDLGVDDIPISGRILIHHINPITLSDIENRAVCLFDLNNLVCVSHETHNAIHYGAKEVSKSEIVIRSKNDTSLWRV